MALFEDAVMFAISAHNNMKRKSSGAPYILHLMDAAAITGLITIDEEILAAVILHDVVEDTDTELSEIREKFGDRVADLVASETEDKRPDISAKDSWKIRKQEALDHLKNASDPAIKIMWVADKLSNMRSLYKRWKNEGDDVWKHFNQSDPAEQAWYYRTALKYLADLKDTEAYGELELLVETIFKNH